MNDKAREDWEMLVDIVSNTQLIVTGQVNGAGPLIDINLWRTTKYAANKIAELEVKLADAQRLLSAMTRQRDSALYKADKYHEEAMKAKVCSREQKLRAEQAEAQLADEETISTAMALRMVELQAENEKLRQLKERAEMALIKAGFRDNGGQEWKPPLGKRPSWLDVNHNPGSW